MDKRTAARRRRVGRAQRELIARVQAEGISPTILQHAQAKKLGLALDFSKPNSSEVSSS